MRNVDDQVLETCDKEPIHIPGLTQHFGCLIAFERLDFRIAAISLNCNDFLSKAAHECTGLPLEAIFGRDVAHTIANKLAYSTLEYRREYVVTIDGPNAAVASTSPHRHRFDIFVHAGPKFDYLEIFPSSESSKANHARIANLTSGMQKLETLDAAFELATEMVHIIAEYDRTMFYRFLPDGSGEVVAECCSSHMEPFLGLRYPAWDIPKQARKLYATTPIRAIADVNETPVPLICAKDIDPSDFDLSVAVLRGSSPIHCEYLRNMGVGATMTIPIVVDDKLWDLITCHNEEPRTPAIDMLDTGEVIGHTVSFTIARLLQLNAASHQAVIAEIRDNFISCQTRLKSLEHFAQTVEECCKKSLSFEGLAVRAGGDWHTVGAAPQSFEKGEANCYSIASNISELTASNDAAVSLGKVSDIALAGFLEVPLIREPITSVTFFRKAIHSHVNWGGKPEKDIEEINNKPRLSPRKSFASYIEKSGDRSDEWDADDIQFALALQKECASSQSAAGRILQQKDNLRILADELNHRVKNILALVKSLSSHARESTGSSEDYAESLERRLFALAASHDMLTRADMEGVSLRALITLELEPYLSPQEIDKAISGPQVTLSADSVPMATLLIHELTSNAVKHGSLSVSDGRVEVQWVIEGPEFRLSWRELGGPEIAAPKRQGFGMELLCEAIPFEFGGTADLSFAPPGFAAFYKIPVQRFVAASSANIDESEALSLNKESQDVRQRHGLVVEDSYLLASEHAKILGRLGFDNIEKASTVGAALSILDHNVPDFALLDINLRDEMSFAIAEVLTNKGVPFAFVTGYGSSAKVPEKFSQATMLKKPLTQASLEAILP